MSEPLTGATCVSTELGVEIVRRLRLKAEEPVLIIEGEDFVLVKRAPAQSPLERFEALAAETAERFQDRKITPDDVDDAVRWSRESS
jgi:hypothetical protein